MPTAPNRPSRVLVYVGLDLMGDGLMKLPFLRALRASFPDAHVTWLAGKGRSVFAGPLAPLVAGLVDEVIDDAGIGGDWRELLGRPLPGRRFDLVIDTQRRLLTTLILRRVRHRTFVSGCAGGWLSDARPAGAKPRSMIGQMLALLEAAGGDPAAAAPPPPLPATLREAAARRLPDGPAWVGLAPGAGGRHKCWPRERFAELARRQAAAGRAPVFVLGPDEAAWEADLAAAVPEARFPLQDAARETGEAPSPLLTIALAERMAGAVANDSGTGHMLAAGGVPLVSLFGPTPPEKFAPTVAAGRVVRAQDFGGDAMDAIPTDAVAAALDGLLAGAPTTHPIPAAPIPATRRPAP